MYFSRMIFDFFSQLNFAILSTQLKRSSHVDSVDGTHSNIVFRMDALQIQTVSLVWKLLLKWQVTEHKFVEN